jgi:hypothetical protein
MDREACINAIGGAGFGELVEFAEVGLLLEASVGEIGVGRLGGLPRLADGSSWPRTRYATDEPWPLTFVAEIDLAKLDPTTWPGPRSGSLSFFCDVDEETLWVHDGGAAMVMHHPPEIERHPVDYPDDLGEELRYQERRVTARAVLTLPPGGTHPVLGAFGDADPDKARQEAYWRLRMDLLGAPTTWTPLHQLLGWPLRNDPSLLSPEPWSDLHAEAVAHGLSDDTPPIDAWQTVLQVASDADPDEDSLGTAFGDGGTLTFAIPCIDLRAGRFDRAEATHDSG